MVIAITVTSMDMLFMSVNLDQVACPVEEALMDIALHAINMDTKLKNAYSRQMHRDLHPNWLALIEGVICSMSHVPLVEILVMLQ